ncbi:interleukin-17C-like [Haliotis cracherodii]|uniref:interleukin-17C-like n=1 Tax=Haliotis cracherodii TaxID=6455 RepID=UPI0039EB2E52
MCKVALWTPLVLLSLTHLVPSTGDRHDSCRHTPQALEIIDRLQSTIHPQMPFPQSSRVSSHLFPPVPAMCPQLAPMSDEINLQSLCPWEYYENHDENRYPHNIIYANCTCAYCLGNNYLCRPVYHSIPVIKQICRNGVFDFHWDNEHIPVGCTCSHPGPRRKKWYFL